MQVPVSYSRYFPISQVAHQEGSNALVVVQFSAAGTHHVPSDVGAPGEQERINPSDEHVTASGSSPVQAAHVAKLPSI